MSEPLKTLIATGIPVVAAIIGASWAAARPPSVRLRSAIQHFAGGLVLAVVATELIPEFEEVHPDGWVIGGFVVGVAAMVGLSGLAASLDTQTEFGLVTVALVALNVFIDGILIGIALVTGSAAGPLLVVALTVELLSLGVAVAVDVQSAGATGRRQVGTVAAVGAFMVAGGMLGVLVLGDLRTGPMAAMIAFATVALMYLVTEELLTEAHETADTPALTATFFAGFLVILLLSFNE